MKVFLKLLSVIALASLSFSSACASEREYIVTNQAEFDAIGPVLNKALKDPSCTRLRISIRKGVFYYKERHLWITDVTRPDFTLQITGKRKTVIMPSGKDFSLYGGVANYTGEYSTGYGFVADGERYLDVQSAVCQSLSQVENVKGQLYRLRTDERDYKASDCGTVYILLTSWYLSCLCKVDRIENGYVYFTYDESLSALNGDYSYKKKFPKYILYNIPGRSPVCVSGGLLTANASNVHQCEQSNFLTLARVNFAGVSISGIRFMGCALGDALIKYVDADCTPFEIAGCRFDGMHDRIVNSFGGKGLYFHDNYVTHSYYDSIVLDPFTSRMRIERNHFVDNGYRMLNRFDIVAQGEDFQIRGNVFQDFSYSGVGVGLHYLKKEGIRTSGIVEGNEFFQSESFRRAPGRTLMDSGAIYLWTMNKDVVIRNNYIHDIDGGGDNRGIFGDDGAVNVKVDNNIVTGVINSYCVDFRKVLSVEKISGTQIRRVNVGNLLQGNRVDGTIRFVGREDGSDDGVKAVDNEIVSDEKQLSRLVKRWRKNNRVGTRKKS